MPIALNALKNDRRNTLMTPHIMSFGKHNSLAESIGSSEMKEAKQKDENVVKRKDSSMSALPSMCECSVKDDAESLKSDLVDDAEKDKAQQVITPERKVEAADEKAKNENDFDANSSDKKTKLAVKIIRTQEEELIEVAYEEYKLLRNLWHDNIVRMHDAFYNQMKSTIFLVMDLVPGHSLKQIFEDDACKTKPLQPTNSIMTVAEVREAFKQLLSTLDYLQDYEVGVVHRDINPNNIMIDLPLGDEGDTMRKVKMTLIDFNVAKRFLDTETGNPLLLMTNTGTARYQAPEMLTGRGQSYDERVDMWSAGAVLYYMLTGGYHAFNYETQEEIEAAILKGDYIRDLKAYKALDDGVKDLIQGLMTVDFEKRLTVQQAMDHPWVREKEDTEANSVSTD